jgi:hypothetical protein
MVIVFSVLVLGLIAFILCLKNKNKNNLLKLHEALENLNTLRNNLDTNTNSDNDKMLSLHSEEYLKERLREQLLALHQESKIPRQVSSAILLSEAYSQLQKFIADEKVIVESNILWKELEETIIKSSPDFKYRLQLLTGGKLKVSDYHLAILIKCGVTPTQMTILVGKAKGTISYRREKLCVQIFGQKLGIKVVDDIIRSL